MVLRSEGSRRSHHLKAKFTSSKHTEKMDPAGPFPWADSLLQAFSYEKLVVPGITFLSITIFKQLKNLMC